MKLILIGMRGSGKSTIANLLSKKMKMKYYDLDLLLTEKEGLPISEIITRHGWNYFRNKESELAVEIAKKKNAVIATGGGIILREQNITALRNNSKFILLHASVGETLKRIGADKERPALTDKATLKEEFVEVWKTRKSLYERTADVTIQTDQKQPDQIVQEIITSL